MYFSATIVTIFPYEVTKKTSYCLNDIYHVDLLVNTSSELIRFHAFSAHNAIKATLKYDNILDL